MAVKDNFARINGLVKNGAKLIAVSKNQPDEKIQAALDAGHRLFGENKVQEAKTHWASHRARYPDLELHLIGPLQTNKAKDAVAFFDYIQTLDRESLVDALAKEETRQKRKLFYFIQVNTGRETQKSGVDEKDLSSLLTYARAKELNVAGLMCIPPFEEDPVPHFQKLRHLAQANGLSELSMGMSADFEAAIACGATYVRVGTGLFGERSEVYRAGTEEKEF